MFTPDFTSTPDFSWRKPGPQPWPQPPGVPMEEMFPPKSEQLHWQETYDVL